MKLEELDEFIHLVKQLDYSRFRATTTESIRMNQLRDQLKVIIAATSEIDSQHLKEFGVKYCQCSQAKECEK